jgi:voltage-gated potassium channel
MNIPNNDKQDPFFYIKIFQYLIIIRLLRFFRLCRYIKSLRILFYGIEKAFKNIMSIGFIILFFVFTFGVIIQVIEKNWDRSYVTRLEDLFNIVTISTITVGDAKRVPISPIGKILCAFLAGIGLIGINLPSPTICQIFQTIYRIENIDKRFITIKYIYPNGKPVENQRQKKENLTKD